MIISSNEEALKLVEDNVLFLEDDLELNCDLKIEASINCHNIIGKRFSIDALNIDALNINAWNIDAGDISYYAFCIAYKDIKCNSIKGRRENSFHKALDGKIIITKIKREVKK